MARLSTLSVGALDGLAALFAGAYPASASWLATPSNDPEAERVREAILALAGTVFDRATEISNEGFETIGARLCPSVLRATPSATILELTPRRRAHLRRGARAETIEGYPFVTTADCELSPIYLERARARGKTLEFDIVAAAGASLAECVGDSLEVFVHTVTDTAARLCAALPKSIVTASAENHSFPLDVAVDLTEPMVEEPDGPPQPALVLRDFFQFPARFARFRLVGLSRVTADGNVKRAKISAVLPEALELADFTASSLRANCVLATNLFETTADPMSIDAMHVSAALRIAGVDNAKLFEVLEVTAVDRNERATSFAIPSVRRLGVERIDPRAPFAYSIEREATGDGQLMVLTSPMTATPVPNRFVVSARLLATNGRDASMLAPGAVSVASLGMDDVSAVRNIVSTSWSADAPTGMERVVRVEAFAQLPGAFSPLEALRNLLLAMLPTRNVPRNVVRATRRRIASIEHVSVEPYVRSSVEPPTRGYLVRVGIDESAFDGRGEVELFALLLQAVLRKTVPLGAPVRVEAHLRIANESIVIE